MLLLSVAAFAQNDVTVKVNSLMPNVVAFGNTATVEFWYTNQLTLAAMTNGFEFTSTAGPLVWTANGDEPSAGTKYIDVEPAYNGTSAWNLGGWQVNISAMPAQILVGGAALPGGGLPAHAVSTKVYSMTLDATGWSNPTDIIGGFCVDNIFFPPAGSWTFDPGTGGLAPTFNGQPNNSEADPSAPPICFDVINIPCLPPVFTSTPGGPVNRNHCLTYTFDFNATEGGNVPAADPVTFSASAGTINPGTGELSVNPLAACGTTDVTVTAANSCGSTADYNFTITWTNNNPAITNCGGIPRNICRGGYFYFPQ